MTTELTLMTELGRDIDLLIRPDDWLENQRKELATRASLLLEELDSVLTAQRLKRELQQTNRVAVLLSERTQENQLRDVAVKVMSIKEAIALKSHPKDDQDRVVLEAQVAVWRDDGYDTTAVAALL